MNARSLKGHADHMAAQSAARMGGNDLPELRVTDEASWLDYERERLIRQAYRRSAAEAAARQPAPEPSGRVRAMTLYACGAAAIYAALEWGIPLFFAAIKLIGDAL